MVFYMDKCDFRGRAARAQIAKWAWFHEIACTVGNMGDLVDGIGDEVLLFGAFLAFTACIVIVVNFWQNRTSRDRQARPPQGKFKTKFKLSLGYSS